MPKAARTSRASARAEPYTSKRPSPKAQKPTDDKENVDPTSKSSTSSETSKSSQPNPVPNVDWRDIPLEEKLGEVPLYEKASVVRQKLQKLLDSKALIPCHDGKTKWSQASMVKEMQKLEANSHPVKDETRQGADLNTKQMSKFLKKSGGMGGGDSPIYYWGYVLLEKLRIHEGGKKTKTRLEAEEKMPNGHWRVDPKTLDMPLLRAVGIPKPPQQKIINKERGTSPDDEVVMVGPGGKELVVPDWC